MTSLVGVPWMQIAELWPAVGPLIEQCYAKSKEHRYNAEDIKRMLTARDLQLWMVEGDGYPKLMIITQIVNYPQARECNIFMVCGTMPDDWHDILASLKKWAACAGCQYISAMARKGWAKYKFAGWDVRETYVVGDL